MFFNSDSQPLPAQGIPFQQVMNSNTQYEQYEQKGSEGHQNIINTYIHTANPNRVDNTTFKTGVSGFRKLCLAKIQDKNTFERFRVVSSPKLSNLNLGTYPKMLLLCEKANIIQQLRAQWPNAAKQLLQSKKNKISSKRYLMLQDIIQRMTIALNTSNWQEGFKIYWGDKFRQKGKFLKAFEETKQFRKKLFDQEQQ